MSITNETVRVRFVGDDASSVFAYPFRVDDSSDLRVIRVTLATGATEDLVAGVTYTVNGIGSATGGDVTLIGAASPLASTYALVLLRDQPATQPTDYISTGRINPETIETSLDKATQMLQELHDLVGRSLQLQEGDVDGSGTYDAEGNAIDNVSVGTSSTSLVTRAYVDLPVYTSQALADADVVSGTLALHKGCIVRITGMPEQFQLVMLKADGVTKVLTTVAMAPLV